MEALFNNSTLFIFFFAMIAIFNYTDLKVHQRISIIYVTVYALVASGIIGLKMAFCFLLLTMFCYLEIFTTDQMKFKLLVNPFYKLVDCVYLSFAQYYLLPVLVAVSCFYYKFERWIGGYALPLKFLSVIFLAFALIRVLQQKFVIASFNKMYNVFSEFPINQVEFNDKLEQVCSILVAIEDKEYFERKQYTNFTFSFIKSKLHEKTFREGIRLGRTFVSNIVTGNRGYSTIPMQLIRTLGLDAGYTCTLRRKAFEYIYSKMFFDGFKKYLDQVIVSKRKYLKQYYLYIYFHTVETKLGEATFSKFLNAFDMQYNRKNKIDVYDCTNEGIFIACMGLSNRATKIDAETVDYYVEGIPVKLNKKTICQMVSKMMDKPYNGNYLR